MNFISVMAITSEIARERAIAQIGYAPDTIGKVKFTVAQGNDSRQNAYVFETTNDVSSHPPYIKAKLSDS